MREAIGNSFVLNFIIVFIIIFILIFVATLTYTKAYKVKNKIVDTIENNDGVVNSTVISEIDQKLGQIGYRVDRSNDCKTDGRFSNGTLINRSSGGYRYCIYEFKTTRGNYYGVVAYAYLQIPIIGANLDFPVYGETKVFLELKK